MIKIKQVNWFRKVAIGITCLFFGLMILVIIAAYSRSSGVTGMDMAKINILRQKASFPFISQNP